MLGFIRGILGFIFAIALTLFAVANRNPVAVTWSPLHPPFSLPAYAIILGALAAGLLLGALAMWLDALPGRWRALQQNHQKNHVIKKLEKQIEQSKKLQHAVQPDAPRLEQMD